MITVAVIKIIYSSKRVIVDEISIPADGIIIRILINVKWIVYVTIRYSRFVSARQNGNAYCK